MQGYTEQDVDFLLKVVRFASEKHMHQRRKDEAGSAYINHPIKVAQIIWEVGEIRDLDVIAAALLHDTIEDTGVLYEDLEREFSEKIADIVSEVTDDKKLDKQVRKQLQIDHAPHLSSGAKLVKLGDKICNVEDIHQNPPSNWELSRRQEYLEWANKVVNGLRGTNTALEARFDLAVKTAEASLRNE